MKVYIVFYINLLGEEIFCDVFTTHEAAQKYADALNDKNPSFELVVQEWEVREE